MTERLLFDKKAQVNYYQGKHYQAAGSSATSKLPASYQHSYENAFKIMLKNFDFHGN